MSNSHPVSEPEETVETGAAVSFLPWPAEITNLEAKSRVAERVAGLATDGDVIGIGAGSTAYLSLRAIAHRVRQSDLHVHIVASSYEIEMTASALGLHPISLRDSRPTWIVDGLDEIDGRMRVLKGRGGALFREKLLWSACSRRYVVIDESKKVDRLGSRFPVPIEVHPGAIQILLDYLATQSYISKFQIRVGNGKDGPVITESGFLIIDAYLDDVPAGFHNEVKALPGVLETGIFEGYDLTVIEEG